MQGMLASRNSTLGLAMPVAHRRSWIVFRVEPSRIGRPWLRIVLEDLECHAIFVGQEEATRTNEKILRIMASHALCRVWQPLLVQSSNFLFGIIKDVLSTTCNGALSWVRRWMHNGRCGVQL